LSIAESLRTKVQTKLTTKEKQIFALVGQGMPTKEIARIEQISVFTVNNHRKSIIEKLGLTSAAELIQLASIYSYLSAWETEPNLADSNKTVHTKNPVVLVVDDNKDFTDALSMVFRLWDFDVISSYNGIDGLDKAIEYKPAIMIIDILMPELDGYEFCLKIRECSWSKHTQLVACTGLGSEEHQQKARNVGFDFFITKPINYAEMEKLFTAISRKIKR